ncbi:hypothetical protein I6A95_016915 [Clostridioides difficile]
MTNWSWISWGMKISAVLSYQHDTDTTYSFLVALAFSQIIPAFCEGLITPMAGVCPTMCGCYGRESGTGQVPGLEKIVAVIRSREISLTLFIEL